MPNASHRFTKRAALSAESLSRMPPRWRGWEATMPTGRPPIRARQVMIVRAHFGLRSSHEPSSTISRITSYMSYGLRLDSGRTSSSASSIAVHRVADRPAPAAPARSATGSTTGTRLMRAMHSSSSAHLEVADAGLAAVHARAAELLLRDVLADRRAHEVRARERHRAAPATPSARSRRGPGMYAVPAAHGPISAATCGTTPLITTSSRNRCAGAGEQRADRLLDARAGAVEQPHDRDPLGQRQLAQRVTLISPVIPIEPAMTVKS